MPRPLVMLMALALALAACVPRDVPPVPDAARGQAPAGGAPALAWRGEGRLEIAWPGHRLSVACWLRATPGPGGGEVRVALVGDGGVQLADLAWSDGAVVIHQVTDDLRARAPMLARLIGQVYATPAGESRSWDGDRLRGEAGATVRWYGGDPMLLRRVDGADWPLVLADYRPLGGGLVAHEVRADGPFGAEVRLRLKEAKPTVAR